MRIFVRAARPSGGGAGPVDEVGAAVLGDLEVPLQRRVGVEGRGEADRLLGQRPVHRVVGEHDDHRGGPRAGALQLVDEPADLDVGRGQRRGAGGLQRGAGQVGVADPVDVAEVDEHHRGVELVDHRERRVHRGGIGGVPGDGEHRERLPAVGGPVAEDRVEVLLRQHRARRTPRGVELLDDRRHRDVGRSAAVADGAVGAVVDAVGRYAVPGRPAAGHHHHVVGDGLHHRQRTGSGVPRAAVAQRLEVGHLVDLAGTAAVDDDHVGTLRRGGRVCGAGRAREREGRAGDTGDLEHRTTVGAHLADGLVITPPARRRSGWSGCRPWWPTTDVQVMPVFLSARSPMTNQSICARFAVMSRIENPWSSKSMYLMCGLLALSVSSTATLVVCGGVPVMSLEVVRGHRGADELDAHRVARPGVRRLVGRQVAGPPRVDVAGDEERVGHAVVPQVLEDLAAVVGVAVPLVDVVGHALGRQQSGGVVDRLDQVARDAGEGDRRDHHRVADQLPLGGLPGERVLQPVELGAAGDGAVGVGGRRVGLDGELLVAVGAQVEHADLDEVAELQPAVDLGAVTERDWSR